MEHLNKCGNEKPCSRGLGNGGSQSSSPGSDNGGNGNMRSGNHSNFSTEYPLINVYRLDKTDEETRRKLQQVIKESNANFMNYPGNEIDLLGDLSKDVWITVSERREIFPKLDEKTEKIHKLPAFRCCSVEHNYCQIKKSGLGTRAFKVRKSNCLKKQGENTSSNGQSKNALEFENSTESDKKRTEEQTIVAKDSTTKHVGPNPNSEKTVAVNQNLKRIIVNKIIASNSQQIGHAEGSQAVKSPQPKVSLRKSSKGNCYDIVVEDRPSMPPPVAASLSDPGQIKQLVDQLENQNAELKSKRKSDSHKRGINQDEFIYKVVKMDDCTQQRSATLSNAGERNLGNMVARNSEVIPVKVTRLSTKEGGGHALVKPNPAKTVPGDKNWNLEYTEDDVRNLGLDDLILKASEVNAENFTKALGRNSGGSNGNKTDSPEVLLSFPRSKRVCDEPLDGDNANVENIKKAKLEFLKKCVTDDKVMEESLKKIPELPKKPGIKVKTVQNINAEFKDSLGAKGKLLDGEDIFSQSAIPSYAIDDMQQSNQTKGILVPVGRERVPVTQPVRLTCRNVNRQQTPMKKLSEMSQETRPFIMTIASNKNIPRNAPPGNPPPGNSTIRYAPLRNTAPRNVPPGNVPAGYVPLRSAPPRSVPPGYVPVRIVTPRNAAPQVPARLAPKVFIKPKTVFTQHGKLLPAVEGRPRDATVINAAKGTAGACPKSRENIAVASEPRSVEVVTVDDNPEASAQRGMSAHYIVHSGSTAKKDLNVKSILHPAGGGGARKKNIPVVLCNKSQYVQVPLASNQKFVPTPDGNKQIKSVPRPQDNVVNISPQGGANIQGQRIPVQKTHFSVSPIKQKVQPKNVIGGTGVKKYVQITPNMVNPGAVTFEQNNANAVITPDFEDMAPVPQTKAQTMGLTAFANIMKDIIPEKWILYLDKTFGLQMLKVHLDEYLNPSIMISVVVGRSGKVTINVRGRRLERSHYFYSTLCEMATPNNKISINHILSIINKLRFYSVCFGCDDLTLKKYWCEDGFIEYYTEFQQTYRSHICESLVRLGRKRCHPCFRMHESLKKRRRREQLAQKREMEAKAAENATESCLLTNTFQGRGTKRNTEEFIEEAFTKMRQKIADEIEKLRAEEENQRVPRTQDEVLGFMGLTRKESLDVTVRKSKREKKKSKKGKPLLKSDVNKEELYFLEKYWHEITVLFSTSLLVGAYSRTSMTKLKEKCKNFYKLLAMWREIIQDNAVWMGEYINLAEYLVSESEMADSETVTQKFDRMDVPALRAYIINCVKEVNRMKNRLRTKNTYFRLLYNNFVKPNMKRVRQGTESVGSPRINMNLATQEPEPQDTEEPQEMQEMQEMQDMQDMQDEEITPDKFLELELSTPPEYENSDDISHNNGAEPCAQERVIIYV